MFVSDYSTTQAWRTGVNPLRRRESLTVGVAIAFLFLSVARIGNADDEGGLDKSFGKGGIVITERSGLASARAMRIQKDDKIVVAGYSLTAGSGASNFALTRYDTDGSLDSGFGNGGVVITQFPGESLASALAIQSDGKLVVGGWLQRAMGADTEFDFALARYNADGTLDQSFGDGGKATTDFSRYDFATAVAIQSDGKIVLAGNGLGSGQDFALARYNTDGSLDTTFGKGGKVQTDFDGRDDWATAASIQVDGKIIVVGYSGTWFDGVFALARYNSDGTLDQSFGTQGKVSTAFEGKSATASALVLLNFDSTILVAGRAGTQKDASLALAAYKGDGTLDESFGEKGRVLTSFPGGTTEMPLGAYASSIAVQKNGKIVVGGYLQPLPPPNLPVYPPSNIALVRFNSNGTLDTAFGSGGKVVEDLEGADEAASAVAIQPDGNILVAGTRNYSAFAVARYTGDHIPVPRIVSVSIKGKDLVISGKNFDLASRVYVNDRQSLVKQKGDPPKKLFAVGATRLVAPGETATIVVENGDGTLSREFQFTRFQ